MPDDPKTRGTALITQLVPLFDEADRVVIEEKFTKTPKNEAALLKLGEAVLRQDEFSRMSNEVGVLKANNEQWRKDLGTWKSTIEARLAAKGFKFDESTHEIVEINPPKPKPKPNGGDDDPNPPPVEVDLTQYVKADEVTRRINEAVQQAQGY